MRRCFVDCSAVNWRQPFPVAEAATEAVAANVLVRQHDIPGFAHRLSELLWLPELLRSRLRSTLRLRLRPAKTKQILESKLSMPQPGEGDHQAQDHQPLDTGHSDHQVTAHLCHHASSLSYPDCASLPPPRLYALGEQPPRCGTTAATNLKLSNLVAISLKYVIDQFDLSLYFRHFCLFYLNSAICPVKY